MSYSVSESVSGCNPVLNHIEDQNDFLESKQPAAKTSKDIKPQTIS